MRKLFVALPVAALMVSSLAFAADQTSTAVVGLEVDVTNVCTWNIPDNTNRADMQYNDPNTISIDYNAVEGGNGKTAYDYAYRCTDGTTFGTPSTSVKWTSEGPNPDVTVTPTAVTATPNGGKDGTTFSFGLNVNVPAGQFNVKAGAHVGTITTTVTYN